MFLHPRKLLSWVVTGSEGGVGQAGTIALSPNILAVRQLLQHFCRKIVVHRCKIWG